MTERFRTITVEKIGPAARLTLARPERAKDPSWPGIDEGRRRLDSWKPEERRARPFDGEDF